MKKLVMSEFDDFECIGGVCPDTCCVGWKVYIDSETLKEYEGTEGKFGYELRENITKDEKGLALFSMKADQRCPFLNEDNLCRIYRTLGPDAMCDTCQNYPRIIYRAGDILFASLSISCPEAGRMILKKEEKQQYIFIDSDEEKDDGTDWERFNDAIRAYTTLQGVFQEREFYVRERLAAALVYAFQRHELASAGQTADSLDRLFADRNMYPAAVAEVLEPRRAIAEKITFIRVYTNALLKKSRLPVHAEEFAGMVAYIASERGRDAECWASAFQKFDEYVPEQEQEQLLVYLLFRHFMEKYKEKSVLESTTFLIVFYSAYRSLSVLHYLSRGVFPDFEWRLLMVAGMSRQFEHSSGVYEYVEDKIRQERMDRLGFLLHLVN
ncbi:MAG: flagellin lysine-N-methylase [Lachnospiraceae bacterium]|nr:flagellin lysine-N-methylase [Lachnospiraceae bacterium]